MHAQRRRRVTLTPADQSLVRRDLHEHRLLELLESRGACMIEAIPEPYAPRQIANWRQLQRFTEGNRSRRVADDNRLDARNRQRPQRVAALLSFASGTLRLARARHVEQITSRPSPRLMRGQ